MECIFLFLSFLHSQFHLSVIDGTQMDLTGIATSKFLETSLSHLPFAS